MKRSWLSSLVAVLTLVALPSATAAPAGPGQAPLRRGEASAGEPGRLLTLVTGDRVVVHRAGDGGDVGDFAFVPAPGRPAHGYVSSRVDGRLLVIPRDVTTLVPRVLDPALFDVTTLLREQRDDTASTGVPVIWQQGPRTASTRMPGATRGKRALRSIRAESLEVPKAEAAVFGAALVAARRDPGALPRKVWLDRRVRGVLDRNLSQIGAPATWAAGGDGTGTKIAVLDTGVDGTHPDLVGKVQLSQNFSDSPDALDRIGHGTHVAGIAAGTGAASGGDRRGVAHAATILSAKVLGDDGFGSFSSVIAGVEWAGAQGADVANLSIASDPQSDGSDPLSQAVDATTRATGTLFVAAAGNSGAPRTISAPGAAAEALTVGAVDGSDALAHFSSRGPRLGGGIKPEMTAPGVDVVAPWSTLAGGSDGARYVSLSGTSMATPHVAGAAAVLAQRRPTWTPAQLKAALVSTAVTQPDVGVYDQGGGRLDVPAAESAAVLPDEASLDLGELPFPQAGSTVTRALTWTNTGTTAATVDLSVNLPGAPAGTAGISPATLSLPAGGSGTATLTVQPGDAGRGPVAGVHSGEVVAAVRGGATVGSPFAFDKEAERYDLRIHVLDRDGQPTSQSFVNAYNVDDMTRYSVTGIYPDETGVITVRVPRGSYHVEAVIDAYDVATGALDGRLAVQPQVTVHSDTTVVLDARRASKLDVSVSGQQTLASYQQVHARRTDAQGASAYFSAGTYGGLHSIAAVPTEPVGVGTFDTFVTGRYAGPLLRLDGVAGATLPVQDTRPFVGDRRLPVVDVGSGTEAEVAAARVRGAVAVVSRRGSSPTASMLAAQQHGAALVVLANDTDTLWQTYAEAEVTVPSVTVASSTGAALVAQRTAQVRGTAVADPVYDVLYRSPGHFPDSNRHVLTRDDLGRMAKVVTGVSALPGATGSVFHGIGRAPVVADFDFASVIYAAVEPGGRRTEHVHAGDWLSSAYRYDPQGFSALSAPVRTESGATSRTETWFGAPWRPLTRQLAPSGEFPAAYRSSDGLFLGLPPLADADGHVESSISFEFGATTYTVRRDGQVLGESPGPFGAVPIEPGTDDLELRYDVELGGVLPSQGRSSTVWTFRSAAPDDGGHPLPLLEVDLQLPVDLSGTLTGNTATVQVRRPFGASVSVQRLAVSLSTDGGRTWRDARTTFSGASGTAMLPRVMGTSPVAVRVEAGDANGEVVTQTLFSAALPAR